MLSCRIDRDARFRLQRARNEGGFATVRFVDAAAALTGDAFRDLIHPLSGESAATGKARRGLSDVTGARDQNRYCKRYNKR